MVNKLLDNGAASRRRGSAADVLTPKHDPTLTWLRKGRRRSAAEVTGLKDDLGFMGQGRRGSATGVPRLDPTLTFPGQGHHRRSPVEVTMRKLDDVLRAAKGAGIESMERGRNELLLYQKGRRRSTAEIHQARLSPPQVFRENRRRSAADILSFQQMPPGRRRMSHG